MVLNKLNNTLLENIYILDYEQRVKNVILIGMFIFSLFYIFWLSKNQEETDYIFVASIRTILYIGSYLYSWIFFLLYPIFINPNVTIDNLLIFIFTMYSIIFTVWGVVFIFNAYTMAIKYVFTFGKFNIKSKEAQLINKNIIKGMLDSNGNLRKKTKKHKLDIW